MSQQLAPSPLALAAGDRAPDAPLIDTRGHPARLFDVFRGPRFTLLSLGADDIEGVNSLAERCNETLAVYAISREPFFKTRASRFAFFEDAGHLSQAYGAKDRALVLIRPDGYIGWIGEGNSFPAAETYLNRILGTTFTPINAEFSTAIRTPEQCSALRSVS